MKESKKEKKRDEKIVTMTDDEKVHAKVLVFDAKKSKWNAFKAKMRSHVAQKGMTAISTTKDAIPKDDETFDLTKPNEKKMSELRDMNRKAHGLLLSCTLTDEKAGESVFAIVEQYLDHDGGHAGGHFPNAWKSLEKRYEDKDTIDVADLKQAYYDEKMGEGERPSFFIQIAKSDC